MVLGLGCMLVEVLFKWVSKVCIVGLKCECVVCEVLFFLLGVFYCEVFEDVCLRTRVCLDIDP